MANDVYQLNIVGLAEGQAWESVQHFESNTASDPNPITIAGRLISAFIASNQTALLACMGDDATINGYKAKRINNTGGPQVLRPITPVHGSAANDCTVASISAVILSYYVQGTKTRAGKWFLPALPDGIYDNGVFAAGFITDVGALIADMILPITNGASTFNWGVWSTVHTTFFLPAPAVFSQHLGTQRRRLVPVM